MDVKQAVKIAKDYVRDVYLDELPSHLGLEETEYDDSAGVWAITLGFTRPWNVPSGIAAQLRKKHEGREAPLPRTYKVIRVDCEGKVLSMRNRETANSA